MSEWWICSLAADSLPPVHQMSYRGFCFRQWCVCIMYVSVVFFSIVNPPNYPCYRNSPNSSDLNFTCMTALIGYWKQHSDLITLLKTAALSNFPRLVLVYLLSQGEMIISLKHAINNEAPSREKSTQGCDISSGSKMQ